MKYIAIFLYHHKYLKPLLYLIYRESMKKSVLFKGQRLKASCYKMYLSIYDSAYKIPMSIYVNSNVLHIFHVLCYHMYPH